MLHFSLVIAFNDQPFKAYRVNEMGGACSAYGKEGRVVYSVLVGKNLRERDYWGDPGIDGRIILRRNFRKWDEGVWTGLSWLRIEIVGGHL
jgi:hypothetical protein